MAPNRRQGIIWTNADQVHRRIFAALRGDELNSFMKWYPFINMWVFYIQIKRAKMLKCVSRYEHL